MIVATTRHELAAVRGGMAGRVGVVMTMGALHAGHAALLRAGRAGQRGTGGADHLIATIFVNPLQFGPSEDLSRYPRTLDADLEMCRAEGVDAVFAPPRDEVYRSEPEVAVTAGPLGDILEGAHRPGHFNGVLTVVLKLLNLTRPDTSYFGEKDYQQLTLVRRMVHDLDVPVEIVGVPTVREPDGLARSSRNRYLGPADRQSALALSRALRAGAAAAEAGLSADKVLTAARAELAGVAPDYCELTDPVLGPPGVGPARLLVAARVGSTRLIDNAPLELQT
jgi:pantoate--beta-alanine ligase